MAYFTAIQVTPLKKNRSRLLKNLLLFVVALPVGIITMLSLAIYYLLSKLKSLIIRRPFAYEAYNHEIELLRNDNLVITMVEDEHDITLTELNQEWMDEVYDKEPYLYRIRTKPAIEGIHNRIGCFYVKQEAEGFILQVLQEESAGQLLPVTELLFVKHDTHEIIPIESGVPYYLYNDQHDHQLIRGYNKREHVEIRLHRSA